MKPTPITLALGLVAFLFGGCSPSPTSTPRTAPDSPTPRAARDVSVYSVTGIVHRLAPDGHTAIIAHDPIPGYMMAMTMPFSAKDPRVLTAVYPGDQITFQLLVTTNDAWIDDVRSTGLRTNVPTASPGGELLALEEELDVGDLMPDCVLTNEHGRAFRLRELQGRVLAVTFMFTRCPLPTYCPLMSRNFAATAESLTASAPDTDWHLITLSFDPDFDSPEILGSYARQYRTDTNRWTFATGDRAAVEQLGRQLGLLLFRENGTISHNLRTVVVTPEGRIHHVFRDNLWTPSDLAVQLRAAASSSTATTLGSPASCTLTLTGMACDACALTIQSALNALPGVTQAAVDYSNRLATVSYDPSRITPARMIQEVESLTYGASLEAP